jgi:hypothetical protein
LDGEREGSGFLKERLKFIFEDGLLIVVTLLVSLMIAIATIVGIYALNYVATVLFGFKSTLVDLVVYYSGVEALAIFVLASISLIRNVFAERNRRGKGGGDR